jgi:hypothetical protein
MISRDRHYPLSTPLNDMVMGDQGLRSSAGREMLTVTVVNGMAHG